MSSPPDKPAEVSRRGLIAGLGALAAVVGGAGLTKNAGLWQPRARVATYAIGSYEAGLVDALTRGIRDFPDTVARAKGGTVVLKPNMVEWHPDRPVNTDPRLVVAAAEAFRALGARKVIVAEGPGHVRDTELLLEQSGLGELLGQTGHAYVDLNIDPGRLTRLPRDFTNLGELPIATVVLDADLLVSMPKLKTHHWAGVTLSMKNLFGTVPGHRVGWPKNPLHYGGIPNSVVDLWTAIQPGFVIADGIVGMEGDGPINGVARALGAVLMGEQCPAVDATAARLMGVDPWRIQYLRMAADVGGTVSEGRIEVTGDVIARQAVLMLPKFDGLKLF